MNWKLILRLSILGLIMAIGSIFFIPSLLDSVLTFGLALFYAYQIGRNCYSWRFFNGLTLGMLNGLWQIGTHDLFLSRYLARHERAVDMLEMLHKSHVPGSDRALMSLTGLATGLFWGCVIGVFALIAGMMIKPRRSALSSDPLA